MRFSAVDPEALAEWRKDWKVPAVALLGIGAVTLHHATLGILIKPIQADTGWSLSQITAAITVYSTIVLVGSPFVGRLADRVGVGKIVTAGVAVYLLIFAGLGLFPHSPLQWLLVWAALSLAGLFAKSPIWALAVTKRFHKTRGVALALMGCGLGLYATFIPALTQRLETTIGWRMTYVSIAAVVFILAWPIIFAVYGRKGFDAVSDARATARTLTGGLPGLDLRRALGSRHLWQLAAVALMAGLSMLGIQVHLAPMLQEKGMSAPTVAAVIGVLGISAITGRFVTGYLLDRYSARLIAAAAFMMPVAACLLYLQFDGSVAAAIVIIALFGFAAGAESDVMAFLAARYLGLLSFGTCFSIIYAVQTMGSGIGPLVTSKLHDHLGGYDGALKLLIFTLVAGALLLIALGSPPSFEASAESHEGKT